MIKNVIFDLGNVLLNFQPKELLKSKGLNKQDLDFVYKEIFLSDEWVELDRGTISRKEAFNSITARNPENVELLLQFTNFEEILTPIEDNVGIVAELKNRGYNTYYLTNYHRDAFEYAFSNFDFFNNFDGGIVSADVKLIKPDPMIYKTISEKYQLKPEESLFIDDTKKNVEAAAELGFNTIHLVEKEQLKKLLDENLLG